jgi:cystathionine gamma-lyase
MNILGVEIQPILLADKLGGIESFVYYSGLITHDYLPKKLRQKIGVIDNLICLSVGIEHIDDFFDDLKNALT